ncbi:MAG TPA: hypothetical protein VF585_11550 [Chthoniobacterales bacterium]|jgi:galactose mutarotase-like enzyme
METITREGHTLDVLTAGNLRIMVSRTGAELVSLAVRQSSGEWQGFLYRDGDVRKNPSGWNNHSTVMGYCVHRLLNETSLYRGKVVRGGTHSFLRHKTFPAPEAGEGSLTYRFQAAEIAPEEYPFQVDFAISYSLSEAGLKVTFRFENREEFPTHVSFGLHPGFAVADLQSAMVILPAGRYKRHIAPGNFLSGDIETIDFAGGPMPFATEDLPGSFLLDLADVPNRTFLLEDPASRRKLTLDYTQAPYLTLWSDGNPFICIEPCWGLPDHHEQRPFEEKLGLEIIPPHGTLERHFTIKPELLDASA